MKLNLKASNSLVVAMLVIVALAVAFWVIALGPKRSEASKLDAEVAKLEESVELHRGELAQGEESKRRFPVDYRRMVVLGKAVPGDDDTASLLVEINHVAADTGIEFKDIKLSQASSAAESPAAVPSGEAISPTEAEASLLPLGAAVDGTGLAAMPYTLTFQGSFFEIADFIAKIDSLVETKNSEVSVRGRLLTVSGFALLPDPNKGFPALQGKFAVTTYVTPPDPEVVPVAPETAVGSPASATIGAAP